MFNASLLALVIVVAMVAGVVVGFILKQRLTAKEITSSKKLMAQDCRRGQERGGNH